MNQAPDAERTEVRLNALADAATVLRRHGFDLGDTDIDAFLDHASARLRNGSDHTVVALTGSTGSGKSSLLNAITGAQIARTGVTRPTTSVTQAVTFGPTAEALLDLIGVSRRHNVQAAEDALEGLVLLDLPDFDSVTQSHRMEVDRLVQLVDLMVWVTDPQKYADESLHTGYLQPLSTHADVMRVVLNKIDTLEGSQLQACMTDLSRLLADDGLSTLEPIPVSTVTGHGIAELRAVLADLVQAKQAAVERINADIHSHVKSLSDTYGSISPVDVESVRGQLVDGLMQAAGSDTVASLVARQYRRDAGLATSWPTFRWLRRLRRAPLAKLQTTADSSVAQAEVSRTLRGVGQRLTERVGPTWSGATTELLRAQIGPVTDALDSRISRSIQSLRQPPRWWRPVSFAQTALFALLAVGALWLLGLILAQTFLLIDIDAITPRVEGLPVPTVLVLAAVVLGIVLAGIAGLLARLGARRQARRATARLREQVADVADELVLDPLQTMLADAELATELLNRAQAR